MVKAQEQKKSSCWSKCIAFGVLLFAIFLGLDQIKHRWYIFDQHVLQEVAQANIKQFEGKNDTHGMMVSIATDLEKRYPGHINLEERWVFNNAGGAMGSMWVMHASITEYIIFFGTPLGTEGHTGRFLADDYFIILEGEQWAHTAGSLDRILYKPGEMHLLARGEIQQYKIHERAWALEYARGWIPAMLPFGFADTFFSTLDFYSLYETVVISAKAMGRELLMGKI
ncbi:ERG2/sigma1 receptor-like protein [Sporodiniella umbellata]|nr:ERG2/sigma1 receptor-like protein [Sporodiniella umbellata]